LAFGKPQTKKKTNISEKEGKREEKEGKGVGGKKRRKKE